MPVTLFKHPSPRAGMVYFDTPYTMDAEAVTAYTDAEEATHIRQIVTLALASVDPADFDRCSHEFRHKCERVRRMTHPGKAALHRLTLLRIEKVGETGIALGSKLRLTGCEPHHKSASRMISGFRLAARSTVSSAMKARPSRWTPSLKPSPRSGCACPTPSAPSRLASRTRLISG